MWCHLSQVNIKSYFFSHGIFLWIIQNLKQNIFQGLIDWTLNDFLEIEWSETNRRTTSFSMMLINTFVLLISDVKLFSDISWLMIENFFYWLWMTLSFYFRFDVGIRDIEGWTSKLLPSRQFGFVVMTTSGGIMDHEEARKKHLGGKILGFFF